MKLIRRIVFVMVLMLSLTNGSVILSEDYSPLTPSQEAFLEAVAHDTWDYITDATSNYLPFSWVRVAPGEVANGTYANPAEMGFYLLSYIGAYEMDESWSPSMGDVEAELLATLTQLRNWQTGDQVEQPHGANAYDDTVFYQGYWVDNDPPIVGPGDYDKIVPSIDNALLAASLITIREWADVHGEIAISELVQDILDDMDFMIWYDDATHRFQWGDTNNPMGGGPADYYSNENRLINFVARSLDQMSTAEFQASLDALVQAPATYTPTVGDPITVEKVAWDGSYFTYLAPALFLREMEGDYGTNTIDPATLVQMAYADDQNYAAWGISDAFDICAFDGPSDTNTYRLQGAPPVPAINGSALEERPGLVTPHASALALLSPRYASEAVANLQQLAQFNSLYSSAYGFKDSVMVKTGDANYGNASCRYSLLAQAYIFLAIAEYKTHFIWEHYYLDPLVQLAHQEADLGCSLAPTSSPTSAVDDLDNNIDAWGTYCDNSIPRWSKEYVEVLTPSQDDVALECAIREDSPGYSKLHCYNNLLAEPDAVMFTADFAFKFSPTTCNNTGDASTVQALEFTISKWLNDKRYEFALQWQNVDDGTGGDPPQWRYWDGSSVQWLPMNPPISQCLSGDNWHSLRFEGFIANDQVEYHGFTIDGVEHLLDITVDAADHLMPDQLAIAVQLDANAEGSPYSLLVDNVSFVRWTELLTAQSPVDNGVVYTSTPQFSWNAVPDAVRYEVQLDSTNPPMTDIVSLTARSYIPSEPLLPITYYWRVRAIDAEDHPSPWTQIQSVNVESPDNAAPMRNYFTTSTPALTWNRVTDATEYVIQVDRDPNFTDPLDFTATVPSSTLSITTSTLSNGAYYWRVRAKDGDNSYSNWSTPDRFVIDVP